MKKVLLLSLLISGSFSFQTKASEFEDLYSEIAFEENEQLFKDFEKLSKDFQDINKFKQFISETYAEYPEIKSQALGNITTSKTPPKFVFKKDPSHYEWSLSVDHKTIFFNIMKGSLSYDGKELLYSDKDPKQIYEFFMGPEIITKKTSSIFDLVISPAHAQFVSSDPMIQQTFNTLQAAGAAGVTLNLMTRSKGCHQRVRAWIDHVYSRYKKCSNQSQDKLSKTIRSTDVYNFQSKYKYQSADEMKGLDVGKCSKDLEKNMHFQERNLGTLYQKKTCLESEEAVMICDVFDQIARCERALASNKGIWDSDRSISNEKPASKRSPTYKKSQAVQQ